MIEMANLDMRIVCEETAFGMTITWADEEEYQLGEKFLKEVGARRGSSISFSGKERDGFYLETEQQYRALLEFRRSLREHRKA